MARAIRRFLLALTLLLALSACDKKTINIYDKDILHTPIDCLTLIIEPNNLTMQQTMQKLYPFKEGCKHALHISYRNCIKCNSSFNIQTKALQGMPSSYLNMEIKEGNSLKYSYYIDLYSNVEQSDLEKGFKHLKKHLEIR